MKAAIYIRVSREEQNPQNQLKDCLTINKYGEYELFEEQKSAWHKEHKRDEFNKLKLLIKQRKINHLVVWDFDRIYRNRQSLIEFFKYCKLYQCHIHSFRQQWFEQLHSIPAPFNEMMHDLMLSIMGWLAEEESQKKSERVRLAVRKKGDKTVSYKGNKWGRKSLPKQTKDKILKLHKQGLTIRKIAEEVKTYDKYGNAKKVSKSFVHKTIAENVT